ncbi:hypothetical protein ACQ4PT_064501 [Festuca glaucescens]
MEPQEQHGDLALAARLPEDVLTDVLRRLAATPRYLAISRSVCKEWRAIIDGESLLCTRLPFTGIFISLAVLPFPELFSRPSAPGRPAVSGKLHFLAPAVKVLPDGGCDWRGSHCIQGHCNGLILLRDYVVNPATQRWDRLPERPRDNAKGMVRHSRCNEYLAFDHTVSSHYQVFRIPYFQPRCRFDNDYDPIEEASEWPPSRYILHVFSSRTSTWKERLFVRQGDAAGTVAETRQFSRRLLSVYWRGSLYVHCQNNFVMRLSLSEDKYNIIKLPMDTGRDPYLGLSQNGVYLASFVNHHLRVCIMDESSGHVQWTLKHDYDLNPVKAFNRQVNGPWILEDINYHFVLSRLPKVNKEAVIRYRQKKKAVVQEKFEWNSDDDDFDEHEDIVEAHQHKYFDMEILGFHPYKEIIFLSRAENFKLNATGFAYHLNSFKLESLGSIYPTDYAKFNFGLPNENCYIYSFPYTPMY